MLTKLTIRNFKKFDSVEIPLSNAVVFVGPNNSGKTTALQALALWELGIRRLKEKRGSGETPEKRPGVTINRRDLLMVPAPSAYLLWRALRVQNVSPRNGAGKRAKQIVRIEIVVDGVTATGKTWTSGLEFDFTNEESLICRPLRMSDGKNADRMPIPPEANEVSVAFLPPMSGLTSNETRLDVGAVHVRLGEGRTAEVLRNLCYQIYMDHPDNWKTLKIRLHQLFGVSLEEPEYVSERGEIRMAYRDESNTSLDLSSSGRGLQQTLLLLAYLILHPGSVLLLDEPDAHLEILRQSDIYRQLTETARLNGNQVIIATHSEEVLNQAAASADDSVVAFLGKPHLILGGRTTALKRSLDTVRYDQYYLAEQCGWVLYLEDRTDLDILSAFARRLNHRAAEGLRSPFVVPIGNQPNKGREHFKALAEAKPDLVGFLLVDRDALGLQPRDILMEHKWQRREIENYLCQPETLESFARTLGEESAGGPLFAEASAGKFADAMRETIIDRVAPAVYKNRRDDWWRNVKASDEFLDLIFPEFFSRVGRRPDFRKADYHRLIPHIPDGEIDEEIRKVLDLIADTSSRAITAKGS